MSAVPLLKCLSMADVCLTSLPTIVASKQYTKNPPRILSSSLRLTPYKTQLSSPFLAFKRERKTSVVLMVARTSDWAQQEEKEGEFVWGGEEDKEGGEGGVGQEWVEGEEEDGESGVFEGGVVSAQARGGEDGGAFEENYPEPSEEAKIFVGNLPFDMDSEKLANLFDKAGIVEVAEVIYNRETDQSRGFGFVTMSTVNEAEKAVEMFNRYEVSGRFLTVNKASPKGQRFERPERGERSDRPPREFGASFRLYVGNLPWQVDDSRLQQLFSEHGKVVEARVVYDRETGRSRGFGFVTMSTKNEIDDAISALDGQSLDGRQLRVNVAEEKPRRSFY